MLISCAGYWNPTGLHLVKRKCRYLWDVHVILGTSEDYCGISEHPVRISWVRPRDVLLFAVRDESRRYISSFISLSSDSEVGGELLNLRNGACLSSAERIPLVIRETLSFKAGSFSQIEELAIGDEFICRILDAWKSELITLS